MVWYSMNIPFENSRVMSHGTRIALLAVIALLFLSALCPPAVAARDVRVGIHEIRPSLFTDEQGKPSGIFVDLIQDIAVKEDWNVIYVHGTFQENLDRLTTGQIDLIMALTSTPEREKVYDFNREAVVSSWTQVYAPAGAGINTILDLDKKRIAVLRGDVNAIAFRDSAKKFNINPTYIELDTISEVFEQASTGKADIAVASRVAGQEYGKRYGLSTTPVMFYPNPLGFAVPKGKNPDLLQAIDCYLVKEKSDPSSYYSQTMQKWFGEKAGWVIPPYVWWGFAAISGLVFLFVIMSLVLRREVQHQTAVLSRQNVELQSEVASRTRAEKELQAAYEQLTSAEAELRANYLELGKSEQALMQARKKLSVLNTLTFQEIQNEIFSLSGYLELTTEADCGETARTYLLRGQAILRSVESSLRFAKNYQDMGISQPKWQNVSYVFTNALSHLDFSPISRTVHLDDLEIYADPLLENVFFNLMDNVIRHANMATMVTLHYREIPDGIIILVEDNGPGITQSDKETIFERGYTGKNGSGLFLVREILSITGITIRESGTEGSGTRFEILVPKGEYRFPTRDPA
jgi:ABC-type amino acid transport substrate-binding protein/signal transduction histidine kinase